MSPTQRGTLQPPDVLRRSRSILRPIDRVTEVLFGLIMVLTFTGSLSVATAGREDVRTMLIGALGCNLAWGLIDGILYLMGCMAERSDGLRTLQRIQSTGADGARKMVSDALPPVVASVLQPAELEQIGQRLRSVQVPPGRARLEREDWLGAAGVLLWVFLTTFPVVTPFLLAGDARVALRVSNAIAVAMLFITGFCFGRCAGRNPWVMGGAMLALGVALVSLTMALGG